MYPKGAHRPGIAGWFCREDTWPVDILLCTAGLKVNSRALKISLQVDLFICIQPSLPFLPKNPTKEPRKGERERLGLAGLTLFSLMAVAVSAGGLFCMFHVFQAGM